MAAGTTTSRDVFFLVDDSVNGVLFFEDELDVEDETEGGLEGVDVGTDKPTLDFFLPVVVDLPVVIDLPVVVEVVLTSKTFFLVFLVVFSTSFT